jgi:propanol-preferring alcohol dehydrogenase
MKALVLYKGAKALVLEDRTIPEPSHTEVRIKVSACGLCLTDKHIIEEEIPLKKSPLIPGHQIVGRIDKIGVNVKSFKVGDLVGVTWLSKTCGVCSYCKEGRENLCEEAKFTGYDVDGGYAEYVTAEENFIVQLPETDDEANLAPLLCAGVIGYRSYKLSGIKPGQKLGLIGFGGSAHLVIQLAVFHKCEVYVFTRSPEHKKLAAELGALEYTKDQKLDAIILFAPNGDLVKEGLDLLKRGGKLVINAIHMSDIPKMSLESIYYEKVLQTAANVTREDAKEFIELAIKIPIKAKITKRPFSDANDAIQELKDSKVNGAIVFIP